MSRIFPEFEQDQSRKIVLAEGTAHTKTQVSVRISQIDETFNKTLQQLKKKKSQACLLKDDYFNENQEKILPL